MNNPKERQRRAKLLSHLNKSDGFRKRSSEIAKITSARPDIRKKRASQLKEWREANFEDFVEKCVKSMLNSWHSKPEKALYALVQSLVGYEFKLNQFVKSKLFPTKSKLRQVDMGDKKLRVYIEFDGIHHFKDINGSIKETQLKDCLLNEHIERHNWTLIRISYDQWSGKEFKKECLERLFNTLRDPQPGVIRIGEMYDR